MNRRNFIKLGVPATGAALFAPSLLAQAMSDIQRQFTGQANFDTYDVVINGGGLQGYFAALQAAKSGKKVLLVEKRSSLGYELTAKSRFWLGTRGLEELPQDVSNLLWSAGEASEVHATDGSGLGKGVFGDELTLMAGTLKKNLLASILAQKVDILWMTDVCGLFTEKRNVTGELLAGKHGLFGVKCRHFIDASEHVIFSRRLLGQHPLPESATFVLEIRKATSPQTNSASLSTSL